ncbi:hypothetical protein Tco_0321783 [Tanacetum coccineum]
MTSSHQQSLADVGSETHPPMLERGSYVPWSSRFMRYIERKKEIRKFLKNSIKNGSYVLKEIEDEWSTTEKPKQRWQTEDGLSGDDLKQYDATLRK